MIMTYLHYYRSTTAKSLITEYLVLTKDPHPFTYQRPGYDLFKTIEIDEDLTDLPLDRELSPN